MSFLEKLLDGVAVEWKSISDIFHLKNGYTPSKSNNEHWTDGTIPWFRMDDIRENGQVLSDSLQKVSYSAVKGGGLFSANSIIIATSATIGEHALITVPHLANQRFTCLSLKSLYVDCFDVKFLFYYCYVLADWCKKNTMKSSFASVDMDGFRKFKVPILCPENPKKSLEIQAEIVRILDAFTELTAELTARKKQYSYYRDQLLSFKEGGVEWKALGEVGEFIRGKRFIKADYVEDGISVIHYGEIYTRYGVSTAQAYSQVRKDMAGSLRYAEPGDVVMAGVGETVEDVGKAVAWLGGHKVAIHDDSYAFRHSMNPKYIAYVMQTASFHSQKTKHVSSGKVKRLLIESMKKDVRIPIPYSSDPDRSLAEQARIVSILDKFDALTHSISEGLPREIALRQKQYEHYRGLLLSFPKPEEVAA